MIKIFPSGFGLKASLNSLKNTCSLSGMMGKGHRSIYFLNVILAQAPLLQAGDPPDLDRPHNWTRPVSVSQEWMLPGCPVGAS